jgi:hypothetical protein
LTIRKQRRNRHLQALANDGEIPLRKFQRCGAFHIEKSKMIIKKSSLHLCEQIPNFSITPLPICV